MKRLLIAGAGGQVGQELSLQAAGEFEMLALKSHELDITNRAEVLATIRGFQPDVVINAAAYTAVDKAESELELARRVNADGPRHLASACSDVGSRLIHLSTDFVFDGAASRPYAPDAKKTPLGAYGLTKSAGEDAVREELPESYTVVRTAWVYGSRGNNFVRTILRLLSERDHIGVVIDQVGTPTSAVGLAAALLRLADKGLGQQAILHWTDAGVASWFDFAVAIRELARTRWPARCWGEVRPIFSEAYPTPALRPHFSVLDCRAMQELVGLPLHWQEALAQEFGNFQLESGRC